MIKSYLKDQFHVAMSHNRQNIISLVTDLAPARFLDLGCDDGDWTSQVAASAKAKKTYGIELIEERAALARSKSIEVVISDLGQRLPMDDNSFDLVHANQVIEHVADVDLFASEIFRVLKPGGHVVVSTENGSSWHNIFASIFGWQIFSLTNMSSLKAGLGNPMALLKNEPIQFSTWTHKVIFNYLGLVEFFQAHGFEDIRVMGAGYYPLPTFVASLDPRHAHFITLCARKIK